MDRWKRPIVVALKAILPIFTLAAGFTAAGWLYRTKPAPPQQQVEETAPAVDALAVRRGSVSFAIRSQGTVEPRREVTLAARVSGQIESVAECFHESGFFRAGGELVSVDRRDYELRILRLEASLRSAQAHLVEARQDLERKLSLQRHEATTEAEVQQAQATVQMGQAAVEELEAQLAEARNALGDTSVVAPFDGCVRETLVEVGQFVTVGTPLASCFAIDAVEIRLPVDDEDLAFLGIPLGASLQHGQGPEVALETHFAGQRRSWRGQIVRSEAIVDPRSRMVYLVARVEDPYRPSESSGGQPLAVGMFVEATIRCPPLDDAIVLPESCVDARGRVFLIERDSRLASTRVEVLRREGDWVVARGDLPEGGLVCATRVEGAAPGMTVEVVGRIEALPAAEDSSLVVELALDAESEVGGKLADNMGNTR